MRRLQRAPLLLEVAFALPEIGYPIFVVGLRLLNGLLDAVKPGAQWTWTRRLLRRRFGSGFAAAFAGRASFRCGFAAAGFPDPLAARLGRGAGSSSSSGVSVQCLGTGLSFGSAAVCSSLVPRGRRTTLPGLASGSRVSSSSVTTSAMPRATDGAPDLNRHLAKNTGYASWFDSLKQSDPG